MNPVMREELLGAIWRAMTKDEKVFFLCADFGSPTLDKIRRDCADRFINVGIAEQNLINVSTGLALEGFTVFSYAIAPFITMRSYEQVRVNLSLHSQVKDLNVNLIGVGAGLSYGVSGPTHHCFEDITIMRALPNFVVFSPSDAALCPLFADYCLTHTGPKYMRLDGKALPLIYDNVKDLDFERGFYELRSGKDICLVSTGYMTQKALRVAQLLSEEGIEVAVVDTYFLKGLDEALFRQTLLKYNSFITLEEGFINKGGLDSLVGLTLENCCGDILIKRMGFGDAYVFEMGSREELHRLSGLDDGTIIDNIRGFLD